MRKYESSQPDYHRFEEGEGWLVSYADMVTLLLGLFIILYSSSVVDPEHYQRVQNSFKAAFAGNGLGLGSKATPSDAVALEAVAQSLNLSSRELRQQIFNDRTQKAIAGQLKSQIQSASGALAKTSGSSVEIILNETTLFDSGTATLRDQQTVKRVALLIQKTPLVARVEIRGHTDSSKPQVSVFKDNWALSAARAASVGEALRRQGIDEKKLIISGFADTRPLLPERTNTGEPIVANMKRNRRVEIVVHIDQN